MRGRRRPARAGPGLGAPADSICAGLQRVKKRETYVISFTSRDFGVVRVCASRALLLNRAADWRARPRAARARGLVEVPAAPTSLLLW